MPSQQQQQQQNSAAASSSAKPFSNTPPQISSSAPPSSQQQQQQQSPKENYFNDPFPVNDRRVRSRLFYFPLVVDNTTSVLSAERRIQGIDDPVYEKNLRTVWELLPRGHARFFELPQGFDVPQEARNQPMQGPLPEGAKPVGEVFGMRKFGYRESAYGYRDKIDTVVCIEKVNGECAHIAGCVVNKKRCWLTGSKHTHMLIPDSVISDEAQLTRLFSTAYSDSRYTYASKIARILGGLLAKLSEEKRNLFLDTLIEKQWTANAEAILADFEHLVDYGGISELRFFSISFAGRSPDGLCVPPEKAFEFFKKCGLSAAKGLPRVKYNSDEYKEQIDKVAKSSNYEGVVVYGSSEDGRVACVWKEKSYPYVMERIAREAITGRKMTGEFLKSYLMKRLSTQPADLRSHFIEWEQKRLPYLVQFASFLLGKGILNGKDETASGLRGKWLKAQKEFDATSDDEKKLIYQRAEMLMKKAPPSDRDVVMFVGPPGSGKSSLSRGLLNLLKNKASTKSYLPLWLNQDELGQRKQYLEAVRKAATDSKNTHIILDKCNLDPANRKDYDDLGFTPTVTFVLSHPEGGDALAELCIERAKARGNAHRSLTVKNDKDVALVEKIVYSMLENFDDKSMDTGIGAVFILDVRKSPEELLRAVWSGLKSLSCKNMSDVDVTDAEIKDALEKSKAYEANLGKK